MSGERVLRRSDFDIAERRMLAAYGGRGSIDARWWANRLDAEARQVEFERLYRQVCAEAARRNRLGI